MNFKPKKNKVGNSGGETFIANKDNGNHKKPPERDTIRAGAPSMVSRTVFTDVFMLILCAMIGLQSMMTFEENAEKNLPPVELPEVGQAEGTGMTKAASAVITVSKSNGQVQFHVNDKPAMEKDMFNQLKTTGIRNVVLRVDKKSFPDVARFVEMHEALNRQGVREVSYGVKITQ